MSTDPRLPPLTVTERVLHPLERQQYDDDLLDEVVAMSVTFHAEAMSQHDWHITITAVDGSTMDLYARDVRIIEQAGVWPSDTIREPILACHIWTDDRLVSHYCDDGEWGAPHRCSCGQPAPTPEPADDTLDMLAETP